MIAPAGHSTAPRACRHGVHDLSVSPRTPSAEPSTTTTKLSTGSDQAQNRYSANTAWQKLNVLAHNVVTTFQILTTADERPRTLRRTATHVLRSVATLRFEWLAKAGRLLRPGGAPVLRLASNEATRQSFEEIERALEKPRERLSDRGYLFAGSHAGGERAVIVYTILGRCVIADVEPVAYLADVLPRLACGVRLADVADLLPAAWKDARLTAN